MDANMDAITILIKDNDGEDLAIEMTSGQVASLYKSYKETLAKLADLEKAFKTEETHKKYAQDARKTADDELLQAHTLLSALGVAEKTGDDEPYHRRALSVSTRIAVYIATKKAN
jgi:hypothetical protein